MTVTATVAEGQPRRGWRDRLARWVPELPFPAALLLLSVAIGLARGMDDSRFLAVFNRGFGQSMGYFAILLFCSFFLAADARCAGSSRSADWPPCCWRAS